MFDIGSGITFIIVCASVGTCIGYAGRGIVLHIIDRKGKKA